MAWPRALRAFEQTSEARSLEHEQWLVLLLNTRLRYYSKSDWRIKTARMRSRVRIKDVNYRAPSGLDRTVHDAYRVELRGETLRNRIDNAVDGASLPLNQTIAL